MKRRGLLGPIVLANSNGHSLIADADLLTDAGFNVLEAVSVDEVLSHLECYSNIRAVVSDLNVSGWLDLTRFLEQHWPDIGIVLLGVPENPVLGIPRLVRFLKKPYTSSVLIQRIKLVLSDST
ncbi:response regulator [Mesorhizobium waimense]|uniref:response regulator n=1 Tax=Mesorhizobium waimense TaxID=1300307 RepID=UPI00142E0788|nr:response regulator [Mesorhizobium waimense]